MMAMTPAVLLALVLAQPVSDWRQPDPENLLYVEFPAGRVVIELAPRFAPAHVSNLRRLAREGYFDGTSLYRSQDNYVVQWGGNGKPAQTAEVALAAEFEIEADAKLPFTRLPDGDVYAPEAGFVDGFPAARDPAAGAAWLAHCYGMVGISRDNDPDTGSGADLYVVTGHSPRHLDRNITLVGRVLSGMPLLSALPRGTGPLGFYEDPAQRTAVLTTRLAADLPPGERTVLELLRTDTPAFEAHMDSRRNRREPWFHRPAGKVELCNVPLPARPVS